MVFKKGHKQGNPNKRKKTMLEKYGKLTINIPKTTTTKLCKQCDKKFSGPYWYIKNMKFCSNDCVNNFNTGKPRSKNTRKKISLGLTGRHLSIECKNKKSKYLINFYKQNPDVLNKFIEAGKKHKPRYKTPQGFLVRSKAEQEIAIWFYNKKVKIEYEKRKIFFDDCFFIPDFYLPKYNLYIEYYGNFRNESKNRNKKKKKLYRKINLNIIEIEEIPYNKIKEILDEIWKKSFS